MFKLVVFEEIDDEPPTVSSETPISASNYDYSDLVAGAAPSNTIIGHATISIGYGYSVSEYGYYISDSKGDTLTLLAEILSENGKYAVKTVGSALVPGTYTM